VSALFFAGNIAYSFPPDRNITPPISRPPNFLVSNSVRLLTGQTSTEEIVSSYPASWGDALDIVGHLLGNDPEIDGLLATDQCGKIPYWSGLPTLDLFGLNDPAIAQIIHRNLTWDNYATEIMDRAPETLVVFYRQNEGHLVAPYHLENTMLSEPFLSRYRLDRIYVVNCSFLDLFGTDHTFTHTLLRFNSRADLDAFPQPLSDEEHRWLLQNQPIIDTPDALRQMVDSFMEENEGDSRRILVCSISLRQR
jgi:hypothetical protein